MINAVRLESVRAHADTRIEFDRFTALVGPNSTGKSTVLGVIERACHEFRHPFEEVGHCRGQWFHDTFDPQGLLRRGRNSIRIELELSAERNWVLSMSATKSKTGWGWERSINRDAQMQIPVEFAPTWRAALIADAFQLEAPQVAAKVNLNGTATYVRRNGHMTAFALLELQQRRDKQAYDFVVAGLHRLIPTLEGVRAVVEASSGAQVKLLYDFADAIDVEATAVSEGTLLATAMLVALHSANGPRILLLDDIERGLHPTAQIRFVKQLKQLLDREPELQIIATTHSPYILDELEPSQVRAFARRRDGSIAVKSLAEHPEAKATAGSLTTGQLWALDDEAQWVLPPEERAA